MRQKGSRTKVLKDRLSGAENLKVEISEVIKFVVAINYFSTNSNVRSN